ncbi:polya polymerase [Acidithiobacillus marinus]|uniref:Polya polymerase n=1 Tax=Acidithiobacillus marinus TaxID=187490 RepID=A0A2I1DPX9_9PROT|nr:CCA tRNA nucleotidyltransferase [Acidithiobacillus marinus]PKY11933.1 polya polymerase [Acidithiobacillus marinus]
MDITLPPRLMPVFAALEQAGARILLVGGAVRDSLLGLPVHDWDLEVSGLSENRLEACLAPFAAHRVGARCAVWVVAGAEIALPQSGGIPDPHLPWSIAARRRDFTVNALAWDWRTGQVLDAVGGLRDLQEKRLRMVRPDTFVEDPLRAFRAARLVGQLNFHLDAASVGICQKLAVALPELPAERLRKEWEALLLRGRNLRRAWDALAQTGSIQAFPALAALQAAPQRPDAHPEGDVWIHTGKVLAEAAKLRQDQPARDIVLMLAALLHDLGKAICTRRDARQIWRAIGHEQILAPATLFLSRYFPGAHLLSQIIPLLRWHGAPHALFHAQAGRKAYARLALQVPDRGLLLDLALADAQGAGHRDVPAITSTREIWQQLGLWETLPDALLRGEDLLDLGISPGPRLGQILRSAYQKQVLESHRDRRVLLKAMRGLFPELNLPGAPSC